MSDFSLLKRLAPALEEEAGTVVNKTAKDALAKEAARDAVNAQVLAAGQDAPLTHNMDLSNIDVSKLPATNDTSFQLVGGPQDKGFVLGEAGPISRPPVPYEPKASPKGWEHSFDNRPGSHPVDPNELPVVLNLSKNGGSKAQGDVIDITPSMLKSKWQQLKEVAPYGIAGGAGGLALAAYQGDGTPSAQAAKAPAQPPKDDDEQLLSDLEKEYEGSKPSPAKPVGKASAKATPADDNDDSSAPPAPVQPDAQNLASTDKYAAMQQKMRDALQLNEAGRIGAAMATGMSGVKNNFEPVFQDRAKQIGQLPEQYNQLVEFQKDDPKSPASVAARQLAAYIDPKLKITDQMSANDLAKILPGFETVKTREDATAARKQLGEERLAEMHFKNLQLGLAKESMAGEKQNNAYMNLIKTLDSLRGNPAVARAEQDLYAADKALGIKEVLGGDLNKANPAMTKLYVSEIAKIASGGVPAVEELKALTPSTLRSRFAKVWEELSNHPTPANLGKFMEQYQSYALELQKRAQKEIVGRYKRVIDPVRSRFSEDQNNNLTELYMNRFLDPMPGQPGYKPSAEPAAPKTPATSDQSSANAPSGQNPLLDAANAEFARRQGSKR